MKLIGKDGEIIKFDYKVYENIFSVIFVKQEELETSDENLPSEISDLIKTN